MVMVINIAKITKLPSLQCSQYSQISHNMKVYRQPFFCNKKNGSTLVYFGLGSVVSNLQAPIEGSHPVLYFQIHATEKYSTAIC